MKRIILVLAVMALLVAAFSVPAFATPNSIEAIFPEETLFPGGNEGIMNYGHCQSFWARTTPELADIAKSENPALETPHPFSASLCTKSTA